MRNNLLVGYTDRAVKTRSKSGRVEMEVELRKSEKGLVLSICGSVWNQPGNDTYMGGQCVDRLWGECAETVMEKARYDRLVEIWQRWHLNDMRAGCQHQREMGWRSCRGHCFSGKPYLRRLREEFKNGGARVSLVGVPDSFILDDVDDGTIITPHIYVTIVNCNGTEENVEIREFDQRCWCSVDKLSRPCPECGYKYGAQWLFEEIPKEVVEEILVLCWPKDVIAKWREDNLEVK